MAHHLRPWLDGYRFRRNFAAQAMQVAADSDSDVEQLPVYSHPASHLVEKPAPVPAVKGRIHSVDTFSAVDGPGLRMVVFEQGCAMRCAFCSNPDTWSSCGGEPVSSKDIAAQMRSVAPYLRPGGGGVTCSGGEAMLQPQFTAAVFQEAHALGLTTCLDTTGQGTKHHHWDVVLPHTDMVLFCIKHLNPEKYAGLTGLRQIGALRFAAELKERGIPHWLRYVLIPGHTDDEDGIQRLIKFCQDQQPALQGVELLPYHLLGRNKWEELGLQYPLDGVDTPPLDAVLSVVEKLEAAGLNVICDAKRQAAEREKHHLHQLHHEALLA